MISLDIRIDKAQEARLRKDLEGIRNGLPRAIVRSVNRTAMHARKLLVKEAAGVTGLQQKEVRGALRLIRATFSTLTAVIHMFGRKGKPLIKMGRAKQTATGVDVRFRGRAKPIVSIPHAFIAVMPRGHRGVFLRRGPRRLPIDEQRAPAPLDVIRKAGVIDKVDIDARAYLSRELDNQARLLLERRRQ